VGRRASYAGARDRRPQDNRLLDTLVELYAQREEVEPLVVMERERVLSSGDEALIVIDGRHRLFAAANAGIDSLPVFVLVRADAVFAY
jgi:ParB-like chromosome segregation protein Spo0J